MKLGRENESRETKSFPFLRKVVERLMRFIVQVTKLKFTRNPDFDLPEILNDNSGKGEGENMKISIPLPIQTCPS